MESAPLMLFAFYLHVNLDKTVLLMRVLKCRFTQLWNFRKITQCVTLSASFRFCGDEKLTWLQHEDNKEKKQESQKFHFDAM